MRHSFYFRKREEYFPNFAKRRDLCKKLWEGNAEYVEFMGDRLNIKEAILLAKNQDALYLAWFDGNFSRLTA